MRAIPIALILLLVGCGGGWQNPGFTGDDDDDDSALPTDDDDAADDDDATGNLIDTDGDTIADQHEGAVDPDGDGIPANEDDDSDGDGISDADEAGDDILITDPVDSDGDGTPDFLDTDSDNNGLPDAEEGTGDYDGDGDADYMDPDDDGDGISDAIEMGDPSNPTDTDGDGTPDWRDDESDGDGIPDVIEGADDPDGDGVPSYLDDDSDNDGIPDSVEVGPDPNNPLDSDQDGFYDFEDADADNDGLLDPEEPGFGSDPHNRDTDGDGFTDLAEVAVGTDPASAASQPDGFYAELPPRAAITITVPFTPSILQADVMFVLDTTCSMTPVLQDVANNFSQVASQVSIPDIAFGVAEFNDYSYAAYDPNTNSIVDLGTPEWNDKPFRLNQQVTTSSTQVQAALADTLPLDNNGADLPESAMEGLLQVTTGIGYDQDCDGVYDAPTDVRPFIPTAAGPGADAFGGSVAGQYNPGVPGTGDLGGVGFRDGSVPIVVYATDAFMRDSEANYLLPPGCSDPAGASQVIDAVNDLGGKLIGIGVNTEQTVLPPATPLPIPQMNALAVATGSQADINGDGNPQNLVFQGLGATTVANVISGIEALTTSGEFDLTLQVEDQPFGFVTGITPAEHTAVPVNTQVEFEISIFPAVPQQNSDQVFVFPMQVIGDGTSVLAEWELILVVLAG